MNIYNILAIGVVILAIVCVVFIACYGPGVKPTRKGERK
jgi:hypothetical protein